MTGEEQAESTKTNGGDGGAAAAAVGGKVENGTATKLTNDCTSNDHDLKKRAVADDNDEEEHDQNGEDDNKKKDEAVPSSSKVAKKDLGSKFPSLAKYFAVGNADVDGNTTSIDVVALYFAAGWCPDCSKEVTPAIGKISEAAVADDIKCKIVWIGSDNSEQEIVDSIPNNSTIDHVPFDNVEERANMKRHFGVCASKEREQLGMSTEQRKHGLPTLIVIDARTQRILTENGVDTLFAVTTKSEQEGGAHEAKKSTIMKTPVDVLKSWKAMMV